MGGRGTVERKVIRERKLKKEPSILKRGLETRRWLLEKDGYYNRIGHGE